MTNALVGALASNTTLYDAEVPRLGIRVRPSGRRVFFVRERVGGRGGAQGFVTLGSWPEITIANARKLAEAAAGARAKGESLAEARDLARARVRAAVAAPTVAQVADEFLAEAAAKLKSSTASNYRYVLGETPVKVGANKGGIRVGVARRALGALKIAEVTHKDVERLHQSLKDTPYQANRVLAACSALFSYAERHEQRPSGSNPCRGIADYPERRRERFLTASDYQALGAALDKAAREGLEPPPDRRRRRATEATKKHRPKAVDPETGARPTPANPVAVAALKFLLLSGWREQEALTLRWSDLGGDGAATTLSDTKSGRSIRELGTAALEAVESMRPYRQDRNPHVFPGRHAGRPVANVNHLWVAVRHAAGLDGVRLHDLRHGFAGVGADQGFNLPLIGALLGHTDPHTTARYVHLVDSARKKGAEAVSAEIAGNLAKGARPFEAPVAHRRQRSPSAPRTTAGAVLPFRRPG